MISSVEAYIKAHHLLQKPATVVVGVSGGRDSVALALCLQQLGYHVVVAHCNFQLRGKDSNADEAFVQQLAKKLDLTYKVMRFNTLDYCQKHHVSVQEAARELRYSWFEVLRLETNAQAIAVGHHLDDQIETFFIHLLRGSGVRGLKGMMPRNGNIIRPLLFLPRLKVEKYLQDQVQEYREDKSNSETKYLRNNIRHNLMPAVNALKTNGYDGLVQSIGLLQQDFLLLEDLGKQKADTLLQATANGYSIALSDLKKHTAIEALLYALLKNFGFKGAVIAAVKESMQRQPGAEFFSTSHRLTIGREALILQEIQLKHEVPEVWIQATDASIESPVKLQIDSIPRGNIADLRQPSDVALLDFEQLTFPLLLRKIRNGDRFQPFGLKGSKLVSEFLTNKHISRPEKENTYVIESVDGAIVWLVGHRVDHRFAVTEKTKTLYRILRKAPS
jgi:tRNA(Ile)-lysidine synthase